MTLATDLAAALAPTLGPAEERIHTALPPLKLGGGADVLEFRRAPLLAGGGVLYVSAGVSAHDRPELVLATARPADWAPGLVSKLAAASLQRRFARGGSVPLGDGPLPGLLFWGLPGLRPCDVGGRHTWFLLVVGAHARELAACRTHGTPHVIEILRAAGAFPLSDPRRAEAPGIATLGPSALARKGLSPHARDGLAAAIQGQGEDVESLRGGHSPADLEILAAAYADLGTLHQRALLVQLVQDARSSTALLPAYAAYVRDALAGEVGAGYVEHASLAIALGRLEGTPETIDGWFDDLDAALAKAREIAG